ncbi:MAG: diguanylate cyclase [Fibrobacter sp.]|nr:diguanylate cyclase [Fibrobacter sp.]
MKQFQFEYTSIGKLKRELDKINQWRKSKVVSSVIFEFYAEDTERSQIELACEIIDREVPDAIYMGCSSNGNIIEGGLSSSPIGVVCTICEFPSTQVKLLHYVLTAESVTDVVSDLKKQLAKNPWVKAVSMLMTMRGMSMTPFCDAFTDINPEIEMFGGGAFNPDLNNDEACVFSKNRGYTSKGVVFLLFGGEDMHVMTTFITGWKPLGKEFKVTKADGCVLQELDGKPAYEAYYRYLNIANDEHFFNNTLEFPFFYRHHGIDILRAPISSNEDGSLTMTSDIDKNVTARIAYGDPWTILESIQRDGRHIADFQPEIIKIFSCAARRTYWGDDEISKETFPFQSIAPTSGFYTSGEFLKTDGYLNQHNVTLVVAALREGPRDSNVHFEMQNEQFAGKVSMINRLATFIDAATMELEEVNKKLAEMAISDSLTGLLNRGEIQHRINECLKLYKENGPKFSLIMFDIDYFKRVNDNFGHKEGDTVILKLTEIAKKTVQDLAPDGSVGRWGGEEFMVLLPNAGSDKAMRVAEVIRTTFAAVDFPAAHHKTISVGVTEALPSDSSDTLSVRVDGALYVAKENGRNRIVVK